MASRAGRDKAATGRRAGQVDRREEILAAAARRFAEYGFEATTVRQIADDVNILSGSLYHHFATKEDMLDRIVRDAALAQRERALRIAGSPCDPETRLVTLIAHELAALADRIEAYAIIFNERKFFRRSPDFGYLVAARKEAFEAWRGVLDAGVAQGQFHAGIDSYLMISTVMRMLNSGADWYRNEDGSPLDAMANYSLEALTGFYADFVLRSVRSSGRADAPVPAPLERP